jgi:hypothetical protein
LGVGADPTVSTALQELPDLRGARYHDIEDILAASGFADGSYRIASVWIASHAQPKERVIAQRPEPGPFPSPGVVQLVVSSGSPVVAFRELPSYLREWVVSLPGFDPAEPILAMETLAGTAYKTDDWLFGECSAVLLARSSFADPEYDAECMIRDTTSVSGTLLDGTRYVVTGLDAGAYAFTSVAGVIVYESGDGVLPLGITKHARSADSAVPSAAADGNTLRIQAGTWFTEIAVHPDALRLLEAAVGSDLAAAIRPSTSGGLPIVQLSPPLRWQEPGELPSRIEVDYGGFRVVAGCVTSVTNVVCDATGAVSVEGVQSGFDVSGVTIALRSS